MISEKDILENCLEKYGVDNSYDADTVGGWVSEMLEKVPEIHDTFRLDGYQFEVAEMDGFRVTKVRVTEAPPEEPDQEEKPENQE